MNNIEIQKLMVKYHEKIQHIGGQHEVVKRVRKIKKGMFSDKDRLLVIEEIWAHQRMLPTTFQMEEVIFCPELIYSEEVVQLLEEYIIRTKQAYVISSKVADRLCERDKPDGLITIGKYLAIDKDNVSLHEQSIIIILDGLEQPGNIGTILRSADGAQVDAIFICNKKAKFSHPKLLKASMGSVFTLPIVVFDDIEECISWLRKYHFTIYLADTSATKVYTENNYEDRVALVVGGERHGISKEWYSSNPEKISIPMNGICDSLNVGVAASIILYQMMMSKRNVNISMEMNHGQ